MSKLSDITLLIIQSVTNDENAKKKIKKKEKKFEKSTSEPFESLMKTL